MHRLMYTAMDNNEMSGYPDGDSRLIVANQEGVFLHAHQKQNSTNEEELKE